jgi:hypothetical protein
MVKVTAPVDALSSRTKRSKLKKHGSVVKKTPITTLATSRRIKQYQQKMVKHSGDIHLSLRIWSNGGIHYPFDGQISTNL